MKSVLVTFLVLAGLAQPALAARIKSYNEWKSEKVAVAQQKWMQSRYDLRHTTEADKIKPLKKQVAQDQWNLDVARDLSVTDYFVLYLALQNDPKRFKEVAGKLSRSEVAELMEAYARSLGGQQIEKAVKRLPVQAIQDR